MLPALSILEGKWSAKSDVSVRGLFVPLFTVWTKNPSETFHYEQFTNGAAFRDGLRYCFGINRAKTIYIGAHGDENCIHGFHDAGISRAVIRNSMNEKTGTKRGVFFGACNFVTERNAQFILNSCPRVEWIAGYDKQVEWSDSGTLDLYFFRHFLFPTPGTGNTKPNTVRQRLEFATTQVTCDMAPLVKRLGLKVFVRKQQGGLRELVQEFLALQD